MVTFNRWFVEQKRKSIEMICSKEHLQVYESGDNLQLIVNWEKFSFFWPHTTNMPVHGYVFSVAVFTVIFSGNVVAQQIYHEVTVETLSYR